MFTKKILVYATVLIAVIVTGCSVSNSVSEEELGLRKTDIYTEKSTVPAATIYNEKAPGEAKLIDRSFENAPPMIPHDVTGLLPITTSNNSCLSCHDPKVAAAVQATAIPKSHLYDLRKHVQLDKVSPARYNCSQCHVPQSNAKPLVANEFKADFRAEDGMHKSNLIDNINEGVK